MLEFDLQAGKLGLTPRQRPDLLPSSILLQGQRQCHRLCHRDRVRRPDAPEPWLVWICECKDEARPVAGDEVEEFASKLQQIGVHGVKGTIVSRNGFQQSAVKSA